MRLGVIGAGTWAIFAHLPAFAARADVEPYIVCRRDPELLEQVRERFGFERSTTDWREVIAAKPDLVVLTGPVHLRAEQARAALEAGCHVLAEKPFTVSSADAWDLVDLARERDRILMVCYGTNETGIVEKARRLLIEDGGIGRIENATVVMTTVVRDLLLEGLPYVNIDIDSPPQLSTWGDPATSGGGYSQGQLTHGIGLLFRLLPFRASEVMAFTSAPDDAPVELHDAIALRFDDGAIGTISGSAIPYGSFGNKHQTQVRITGDRGALLLDLDRPHVRRTRGQEDDVIVELTEADTAWSFGSLVDRFCDLAAGKTTEIRSPAELGARVVEVIEAMFESAETGSLVRIDRSRDNGEA